MILICYIFSTNKVLDIRLVILIPLTTIPKFNWQLCLNLTNPNFAWFNSSTSDFFLMAVIAFSYLMMSILSVFYDLYCRSLRWQFNRVYCYWNYKEMCLPMTSKLNDYKRFRNHRFLSTTKIDLNQILYNIKKLYFHW